MYGAMYKIPQSRIEGALSQIMTSHERFPDVGILTARVVNPYQIDRTKFRQCAGNSRTDKWFTYSSNLKTGNRNCFRQTNKIAAMQYGEGLAAI